MKKTLLNASFVALVALVSLVTACRKDDNTSTDRTVAEDLTAHNDISELVAADVDVALNGLTDGHIDERSDCPTVSSTQPLGTWPNTITLDYSDAGCTKDGRTYAGKIIISQTGPIRTAGTVRTLTFDNFSFEGVQVEGSKVITTLSDNTNGQVTQTLTVNHTLTFPDGDQATYQSDRTRTMIEGAATEARLDDVWQISGTASGTNRNGVAYTATISTPLVKRVPCPWISEGVIEFVANNRTRSLDFGDGTCDRDATLTRPDGTEREVKIRHHFWR
jgi:hypothetical protein